MDNLAVLVVEDDTDLREALCQTLEISGYRALPAESAALALEILGNCRPALIVSDVQMPGMQGDELLRQVKRQFPEIPFVLITAYGNVTKAVEAMQNGAADYIVKPFQAEVLIEMVNRLAESSISGGDASGMVVEDRRSADIAELSRRVAATDVTVMISGESGSGKEVFAKFIHRHSPRSNQPFVAINCAAIPEPMLESILFGYEKGAFTGAYTSRAGKFEQANGGTLLLDEVSEIDIGLQAKLLRVIQEREVERLGGSRAIELDVRLIATTNRNLKEEVSAGRFREDLFYRLNVFPLHLPSLRERPADILPLARSFIGRFEPGNGIQLDDSAEQSLLRHAWYGNVRELENVIQRALILKTGRTITADAIVFETPDSVSHSDQPPAAEDDQPQLASNLKNREKEIILEAIVSNSSRKEAAQQLGISPRTLRYKLAQFRKDGTSLPRFPSDVKAS
ncbi:MAG: sigma-54 dependent transcriptional regulator [Gammaproteobacteria bacterium]|nr:sigma-54-dependent Fis family transcriptional regulator [Pseudomonadales bacterium]MCP5349052.1 sigma-54-dependent Fis family transcriptional regulator [Pseudomonadales bacterium]